MKKTLLFIILGAFLQLLTACSSGGGTETPNTGYYFRFKVDGVEKNYNNAVANRTFVRSRNKHSQLHITGMELERMTSNNPTLAIELDAALLDTNNNWVGTDLVAGTYSAEYAPQNGYIMGCNHYITGLDNYTIDGHNFTLNLKHIDKHNAYGTFAGILKDHNGNIMTITEGEFNVKVIYKEVAN